MRGPAREGVTVLLRSGSEWWNHIPVDWLGMEGLYFCGPVGDGGTLILRTSSGWWDCISAYQLWVCDSISADYFVAGTVIRLSAELTGDHLKSEKN